MPNVILGPSFDATQSHLRGKQNILLAINRSSNSILVSVRATLCESDPNIFEFFDLRTRDSAQKKERNGHSDNGGVLVSGECTRESITVQISYTLLQSMKHARKEQQRAPLIWSQAAATDRCGLCNAGCTNMVPRAPIESEIHTLWGPSRPLCICAAARQKSTSASIPR